MIAAQVRHNRTTAGMSAQRLADRCAQLGFPIHRSVIANLESGRRPVVNVAELLVLAAALGMPPLRLLIPLHDEAVELLPGKEHNPWSALRDFTGEDSPEMKLLRKHDRVVAELMSVLADLTRAKGRPLDPGGLFLVLARNSYHELSEIRGQMAEQGLALPELPASLEQATSSGTLA
jgi:transcriptional regulator with XRE-family HTH domain